MLHPALRRPLLACVLLVSSAAPAFAQTPLPPDDVVEVPDLDIVDFPYAAPHQNYVFTLGAFQLPLYTIMPIESAPATYLNNNATLTLKLSPDFGAVTNVRWFRDNVAIGVGAALTIDTLTPADSGSYRASFEGHADFVGTGSIRIHVGTADRPRLANQSSRVTLSPTSPSATFGFVIQPRNAPSFQPHPVLIRVVGPALAEYGVAQPLLDPVFTLRDSRGIDITPLFFTAVILDGKSSEQHYRESVARVSAAVGAFPVENKLHSDAAPRDIAEVRHLTPGAYTLTVRSESGSTGEVLVEIYDAWEDPVLTGLPTETTN